MREYLFFVSFSIIIIAKIFIFYKLLSSERVTGLEPVTPVWKTRVLTTTPYPHECRVGVEPTIVVLQTTRPPRTYDTFFTFSICII